jgi:hypothetical protein
MSPNKFAERFSKYTVAELLEVLEAPEEFEDAAIEAAQNEIQHRNLPVAEMEAAKTEMQRIKKLHNMSIREKLAETADKMIGDTSGETNDKSGGVKKPRPGNLALFIAGVLLVTGLYMGYIIFSNFSSHSSPDAGLIYHTCLGVWAVVSGILLFSQKRFSWVSACFFLTVFTMKNLLALILLVIGELSAFLHHQDGVDEQLSGFSVVGLLAGLGSLIALLLPRLRQVYNVNFNTWAGSLMLSLLISAILNFDMLLHLLDKA